MERLEPLVRELGLGNRIFILKRLDEGDKSVAQIRKELKTVGVIKPFSTVGRYLKSLREMRLVCDVDDSYYLTLKGRLLLRWPDGSDGAGLACNSEGLQHPCGRIPEKRRNQHGMTLNTV